MSSLPRTLACAALLAVTVAGCSGGDEATPAGQGLSAFESAEAAPPTTPAARPTTPAARPARPVPPASTLATSVPAATGATGVPAAVLLPAGAWPGGRVRERGAGLAGLDPTEPAACQERTAYPSDRHRLAARSVLIASDEPESGGVHQTVVRYAPGRAAQAMAEVRRVLAACHSYRLELDPSTRFTVRHRLEAQRFAGDDAVLVRRADRMDSTTRDWSRYLTVVRVGDALVTTSSELGEGIADADLARRLAVAGAARAACLRTSC